MTITISGLGSGLDVNSWVTQLVAIKQADIDAITTQKATVTSSQSALTSVKSSYSDLLTSLQKITDSQFGSTSYVFAQKTATSSNADVVGASVSAMASKQTVKVSVSQLATATTATSVASAASTMSGSTKVSSLANGEITDGSFSLYVNNKKYSIAVASTDTVGGVLDKINNLGVSGLSAAISDGKITIKDTTVDSNIVLGSNSDTTNFTGAMSLAKNTDGSYSSTKSILAADASATLTGSDAGLKSTINEGSFKIGGATFTIGSTTTLNSLMDEINSSSTAGATAYWDSSTGKMGLTSTTEGASNIDIQNISGNFTDVMGLTTSTYNEDGSVASSNLANNSQTLGQTAKLTINGTSIVSSSNTVTSDISGISGLTLNLKAESTNNATTSINIGSNTASLTSAISSFVSSFNTVISNTDEATGTEGYLHGESTLTMIRNNLRQEATANVTGSGNYTTLSSIGITTGAIGASISDDTNKLIIDSTKLAAALAADPDAVKKLLIGDGTDANKGVLGKLSTTVNSALDSSNGYFAARNKTFDSQISDLTDTVTKQTEALATYKTTIETKFNLMDSLISKMKNSYTNLASTLGIDTTSTSSS